MLILRFILFFAEQLPHFVFWQRNVILLNEKLEQIERLPVSQLAERLQQVTGVDTLIFDGIITQRIVDIASDKNIKRIIASRVSEAVKPALNVDLNTFQEIVPAS